MGSLVHRPKPERPRGRPAEGMRQAGAASGSCAGRNQGIQQP
jgi:hypothetical protein